MYISTSGNKGLHVTVSVQCAASCKSRPLSSGLVGALLTERQPATRVRFVILDDFIECKHSITE